MLWVGIQYRYMDDVKETFLMPAFRDLFVLALSTYYILTVKKFLPVETNLAETLRYHY